MSILIPGTEKLAETVDIAVKWGSANLTGKIVPAGTPLTAAGEVATGDKAAAVRGITAIDYGYSPYSNVCPCIVAGVVDMTKVLFKVKATDQDPICVALDQISFIDQYKKVYHPSVVSQIAPGTITANKLTPGLLPEGVWATLYNGWWNEDDPSILEQGEKAGTFLIPSGLEANDWGTFVISINNPCVGGTPSPLFSVDGESDAIMARGDKELYYLIVDETAEPVQVYADTQLDASSVYIMTDPPESGE